MDKFLSNIPVQLNLSAAIYLGGCNEAFSRDFKSIPTPWLCDTHGFYCKDLIAKSVSRQQIRNFPQILDFVNPPSSYYGYKSDNLLFYLYMYEKSCITFFPVLFQIDGQ